MRVIYSRRFPPKGFLAINLFGVLVVRGRAYDLTPPIINHERIHTAQMRELGYLPFYLLYGLEWVIRLLGTRDAKRAYYAISFEREAYRHGDDLGYLAQRRRYAWRRYFMRRISE